MHHASPFYALLEGAKPFKLTFPTNDSIGPYWGHDGELVRQPTDELASEEIQAVQIRSDHFRLTCRSEGPFSGLRLHWTDEFAAITVTGGSLTLTRVMTPQYYVHHRFLSSTSVSNDHPAATLGHELGGGWGSIAAGVLTLSVPATHSAEFMRRMSEAQLAPGVAFLTG
jgi:hypothetical protein